MQLSTRFIHKFEWTDTYKLLTMAFIIGMRMAMLPFGSPTSRQILTSFFVLAVCLYSLGLLGLFHPDNWDNAIRLVSEIGMTKEEQLTERWGDYYRQVSWIKRSTPKDSLIILPPEILLPKRRPQIDLLTNLGHKSLTEYFLFPRHGGSEHDPRIAEYPGPVFRIELKSFPYNGPYLERLVADKKLSLLLLRKRKEPETETLTDFSETKTRLPNAFSALFKLCLLTLAGAPIARKFQEKTSWFIFIVLSFLTGSVASALVYILFSLIGIRFSEPIQYALFGIMAVSQMVTFPLGTRHRRERYPKLRIPKVSGTCFLVMLFFTCLIIKNATSPITGWDACAIYGLKAKSIFALHDLRGLSLWSVLTHYPPLLPILMSQIAVGGELMVNLLFPVFAICLYGLIYMETFETRFPAFWIHMLPLLMFSSGSFFYYALAGYADLALTVYLTASLIFLTRALNEDQPGFWLALAVMLSGAILVRPSGWICFLGIAGMAAILAYSKRGWKGVKNLRYLGFPVMAYGLWKIYLAYGLKDQEGTLSLYAPSVFHHREVIMNLRHLTQTALSVLRYTFVPNLWWGFIPSIFLLILILRFRHLIQFHSCELLYILVALVGLSAFAAYVTPSWGADFFFGTAWGRYAMIFMPAMWIVSLKEANAWAKEKRWFGTRQERN